MSRKVQDTTADLAREMVVAPDPITREMVAGWAARVVDLGVYGSQTVTQLKSRIRQQRETARSYCKYIARLEAKLSEIEEVIQACDVSSGPSAVLAVARGRQILAKKGKD